MTLLKVWDAIADFFVNKGWSIVLAISIFIIAFVLIKLICLLINKALLKTRIDGSAVAFYIALTKLVLWVITIFLIASVLSISTSSLIVGLSSVALAVALALKDSLANLANGIIIIYNKSFRRGDYIEVDGVEGKIINIKLLTSEIITTDNKRVIIPNSKLVNCTITNYTSLPTRRISFTVTVSYDSDLEKVEKVITDVLANDKRLNSKPKPSFNLSNQADSALEYTIKAWVNTEDYWTVYNSMQKIFFEAFKANNIDIPYNQIDVNIKTEKGGDSNE